MASVGAAIRSRCWTGVGVVTRASFRSPSALRLTGKMSRMTLSPRCRSVGLARRNCCKGVASTVSTSISGQTRVIAQIVKSDSST